MSSNRPEKKGEKAAPNAVNEPLYSDVFENAPHAMALIAPDGRILSANRAWCRILGFAKTEIAALNVSDITHPEDFGTDCEQRNRLAAADIGRYELVERLLRKDRSSIWVKLSVSATRQTLTQPAYFVAQIEAVAPNRFAKSCDDVEVGDFRDATFSAIHEIGNSLTPLMLNAEMLVERSPRGELSESARQIFIAARRVAFTLRRLRSVQDIQAVAYLGQDRMLDLRMVAPPPPPELKENSDHAGAA